jgi:hypothetical protein
VELALSDYRRALDFLFARTGGGMKVGLERTRALLDALDNPQGRFPSFHVAGTNGKGSVCATLEALLRAKGLRVGKYTSPHLIDFRERVTVDGVPIDERAVVDFVERWTPRCEAIGATFFEATTALAFHHFARAGVDVAWWRRGSADAWTPPTWSGRWPPGSPPSASTTWSTWVRSCTTSPGRRRASSSPAYRR